MNFEERKAEILRRSDERIAKRKRNRRIGLSVALPVLMVAVLAVPAAKLLPESKEEKAPEQLAVQEAAPPQADMLHRNETSYAGQAKPEGWDLAKDPVYSASPEMEPDCSYCYFPNITAPPQCSEVDSSNDAGMLVLNRLETPPSQPDMDVNFAYLNPDSAEDRAAFCQFTGLDYAQLISRLPWTENGKITLYGVLPRTSPDGYTLHDYVIVYAPREDWRIQITLSPLGWPGRDLLYPEESPALSHINGVEMTVYGYANTHITLFQFQGLFYEVETKGLEFPQLFTVLSGITTT